MYYYDENRKTVISEDTVKKELADKFESVFNFRPEGGTATDLLKSCHKVGYYPLPETGLQRSFLDDDLSYVSAVLHMYGQYEKLMREFCAEDVDEETEEKIYSKTKWTLTMDSPDDTPISFTMHWGASETELIVGFIQDVIAYNGDLVIDTK